MTDEDQFNDPFGTSLTTKTFEEAEDDEDVRAIVQREFNEMAVEAIEEGFDPMTVAQTAHDVSEALKIQLHTSSLRQQYEKDVGADDSEGNDSETTSPFDEDSENHPLDQ